MSSTATSKWAEVSVLTKYAEKHLLTPNPHLQNALTNSFSASLPAITISPLQGQFLALQAKIIGAKNILEIGTLGGYSTLWFASTDARVTSIEISPKHRDVALGNINSAGYGDNVDVILGAALEVMPKLKQEGRVFDFVFIDADWGEQWECFEHAVALTRQGGVVYVDNVVRELFEEGGFGYEERETLVSKVGKMEGVSATVISTVSGWKGNAEDMVDGFLLAVVQ
ncbi:hypothetical protein WAI453_006316 [Rhynchosporium graminicola]|uniref:Related to O-methyltransferase n=1 Tax=Rhynchosporium graminicola TaxID=2792576 RepID=A0A1E1L6R6_9HELO|nr:related to O-methyltransferase [Rhynchosporium commune]